MPKRSSNRQPRDLNQLAASIVDAATGGEAAIPEPQAAQDAPPAKNPHAAALGKLGGIKGGPARAAKLTPEQRRAIARKAAAARWKRTSGS
jgi:hypothetical protein